MSTARPRTNSARSTGGRALMLLGVALAILSAVLVIYIVSQATAPSTGATVNVAVVNTHITAGTPMTAALVHADFTLKVYPLKLLPTHDALPVNSLDQLAYVLNQQVNIVDLYSGDVLLSSDPRFKPLSAFSKGSITSTSEYHIPSGYVLFPLSAFGDPGTSNQAFVNPGDHVDILATECNKDIAVTAQTCETQTTLQNLYVYSVLGNDIILVMSNLDAQRLQLLAQDGTIVVVVRGIEDTSTKKPQVVTPQSIASYFHY